MQVALVMAAVVTLLLLLGRLVLRMVRTEKTSNGRDELSWCLLDDLEAQGGHGADADAYQYVKYVELDPTLDARGDAGAIEDGLLQHGSKVGNAHCCYVEYYLSCVSA